MKIKSIWHHIPSIYLLTSIMCLIYMFSEKDKNELHFLFLVSLIGVIADMCNKINEKLNKIIYKQLDDEDVEDN